LSSNNPEVSIIIPVLNEADTIGITLDLLKGHFGDSYEIIVIDYGSTDGTIEISKRKKVIVIVNKEGGYVGAIKEGIKLSTANYIAWLDGDMTYDPLDIPKLLKPLKDNKADVVIGRRFISEIMLSDISFLTMLNNKMINFIFSMLFDFSLFDTISGFRAVRNTRDLIKYIKFSYDNDSDLVLLNAMLIKEGYRIKEVPITFNPKYGKQKPISFINGLKIIIALLFF